MSSFVLKEQYRTNGYFNNLASSTSMSQSALKLNNYLSTMNDDELLFLLELGIRTKEQYDKQVGVPGGNNF